MLGSESQGTAVYWIGVNKEESCNGLWRVHETFWTTKQLALKNIFPQFICPKVNDFPESGTVAGIAPQIRQYLNDLEIKFIFHSSSFHSGKTYIFRRCLDLIQSPSPNIKIFFCMWGPLTAQSYLYTGHL